MKGGNYSRKYGIISWDECVIAYLFALDKNLALGFAVPGIAMPCLAVPGLAVPRLAGPGLVSPVLAGPGIAGSGLAGPRLAVLGHAGHSLRLTGPGLAVYPIDSSLQNFTTANMIIKVQFN